MGMMCIVAPRNTRAVVVTALAVASAALMLAGGCDPRPPPPLPKAYGAFHTAGRYALKSPAPPRLGSMHFDDATGRYVAPFGAATATLTIEPELQQALEGDLRNARPQWGAVVIFDVKTGAVLAMADVSEKEPGLAGEAVRPLAKAASVFKIVTAAALLRQGVPLSTEVCGNGGHTRLKPAMLGSGDDDDLTSGGGCIRFEDVLPYSRNVAMAKLAGKYLSPALLRDECTRWFFDAPLPVDFTITPSQAPIPTDDEFAFATTAAGFGDVKLSALHGAVLAAIAGNGGVLVPPHLIESVHGDERAPAPAASVRVIDEDTATALQAMMTATVNHGTAARAFSSSDRGYRPFTMVAVAGKTGSLTAHRGYRRHLARDKIPDNGGLDYTWFVGTAPAHDPKIAIAVSMVNDEWTWYARALDIAKLSLKRYFNAHPEDARTGGRVARRAAKGVDADAAAKGAGEGAAAMPSEAHAPLSTGAPQ